MWVEVKSAPNLIIAELWKELLEGEGIPARIMPADEKHGIGVAYRILVPRDRQKVVEEVLRKV